MARLLFIAVVILGTILVWRSRDSAHGRAGKRLLLVGFAGLVIFTMLFSETTTIVAGWLGIRRGTDLVLYMTSSRSCSSPRWCTEVQRLEDRSQP